MGLLERDRIDTSPGICLQDERAPVAPVRALSSDIEARLDIIEKARAGWLTQASSYGHAGEIIEAAHEIIALEDNAGLALPRIFDRIETSIFLAARVARRCGRTDEVLGLVDGFSAFERVCPKDERAPAAPEREPISEIGARLGFIEKAGGVWPQEAPSREHTGEIIRAAHEIITLADSAGLALPRIFDRMERSIFFAARVARRCGRTDEVLGLVDRFSALERDFAGSEC